MNLTPSHTTPTRRQDDWETQEGENEEEGFRATLTNDVPLMQVRNRTPTKAFPARSRACLELTLRTLSQFCPYDSSMLYPKEDKKAKQLMYACKLCSYSEKVRKQTIDDAPSALALSGASPPSC